MFDYIGAQNCTCKRCTKTIAKIVLSKIINKINKPVDSVEERLRLIFATGKKYVVVMDI